jgi:hypothetical protein
VALVARTSASAPLGRIGLVLLAATTALVVIAVKVRLARWPATAGAIVLVLAPSLPLVLGRPPGLEGATVIDGVRVWEPPVSPLS